MCFSAKKKRDNTRGHFNTVVVNSRFLQMGFPGECSFWELPPDGKLGQVKLREIGKVSDDQGKVNNSFQNVAFWHAGQGR